MIYAVFYGYYSDWNCLGYFTNREDADKYAHLLGEDHFVKVLKNLENDKDLSAVSVQYEFRVQFRKTENGWPVFRWDGVDDEYTCHAKDKLTYNRITGWAGKWITFDINIDKYDRKLAEKIAQDYLYTLLNLGNGEITDEAVKEMNNKWKEPYLAKQKADKEAKQKQRELKELRRLQEKYKDEL